MQAEGKVDQNFLCRLGHGKEIRVDRGGRLRLSFLGGASEIGASSTLLQVAGRSILVDCGIRFKRGHALPDLDALTGRELDAVVLTHAHSDHSGALPVLHEAFPHAPIYATPPTIDLVRILQRDALRLMKMAADREGELPVYGEKQVDAMLSAFVPLQHGHSVVLGEVLLTFLPASHILGAAMAHFETPSGSILVTGDYSVSAQRTVPALDRPTLPVDLLVTESTYGNRLHSDRKTAERRLVSRVAEILGEGGRVLIPAFAIGRAQEILLILREALRHRRIPQVPVFVDGMVRTVCQVYSSHDRYVSRQLLYESQKAGHPFFSGSVQAVGEARQRQEILQAGPCVIVASSGMLSGGPSAFYAGELAGHDKDAILITGYQDEESPGRHLLNLARQTSGTRELKLGERMVEVRCHFETYSLSAHADRMQMVGLIQALRPQTVLLVHGDRGAKQALARSLQVKDVVLCEDGSRLERSYPRRRQKRVTREIRLPSPDEVLSLLDRESGVALRIDQLGEAWFGHPVHGEVLERFARALEASGHCRRDDHRRQMVWPRSRPGGGGEPTEEELRRESELKAENPKGRLLELCQRLRIEPPRKLATLHQGVPVAELQIQIRGELVSSGVRSGHTEKVAEQLAARKLLEILRKKIDPPDALSVDPEQEADLKLRNPKGRLLEICQQRKLPAPSIEETAVPGGFVGRAWLRLSGQKIQSKAFRASKGKTAQQAAAADLLEQLLGRSLPETGGGSVESPGLAMAASEGSGGGEPRMRLNEARQKGLLRDFGYEEARLAGPAHQPMFEITAWAEAPGSARESARPVQAATKKAGRREAATRLVAHLEELRWI